MVNWVNGVILVCGSNSEKGVNWVTEVIGVKGVNWVNGVIWVYGLNWEDGNVFNTVREIIFFVRCRGGCGRIRR